MIISSKKKNTNPTIHNNHSAKNFFPLKITLLNIKTWNVEHYAPR